MELKIQIIIAVTIIISLCILLNMIRKKSLELRYALAWIFVGVSILVLDCFPKLIELIAKIIGIASPINMLFFFGFLFSLAIIFSLTMAISKLSIQIRNLSQELGLYQKKIEEEKKE